ncbi:MAG TPA: hypothetical protein VM100_06540 [Longimicrobiales bacterium]|nr:hypothetical protein [Longimicrobiales bacterium]
MTASGQKYQGIPIRSHLLALTTLTRREFNNAFTLLMECIQNCSMQRHAAPV